MSRPEKVIHASEIYFEDASHSTLSVDMDFEESLIHSYRDQNSFVDEWIDQEIEMSGEYFEKELWSD